MDPNRKTTVLFADVIGAEKLSGAAGEAAAHEALTRCRDRLQGAATACGGRVVKGTGDKVMVLISTPDAAADAAVAMHTAVDDLPAVGSTKLALGIGFHFGPVINDDNGVFGDTVNLAARLVEQAASGQIITTEETAAALSALYRPWLRRLGAVEIKGRSDEVGICELVWRADDSATLYAKKRVAEKPLQTLLTLKYRDKKIVRRREKDAITLGRDESCGLVVADDKASRQHCNIERRLDKFVLTDLSSNGTWVTIEGEGEVELNRDELTLRKHGWIAFGQPRASAKEAVEFFCE
jgi:class 3 adenylate cyclase